MSKKPCVHCTISKVFEFQRKSLTSLFIAEIFSANNPLLEKAPIRPVVITGVKRGFGIGLAPTPSEEINCG